MTRFRQNPLLRLAFWVFASLLLLTLLVMGGSLWISVNTQDDAKRINISGSLRMQSFRISQYLLRLPERPSSLSENTNSITIGTFHTALDIFDKRLSSTVMTDILSLNKTEFQRQAYVDVTQRWHRLKSELNNIQFRLPPDKELARLNEIDEFVKRINAMVYLFQASAESKVSMILWVHGLGIVLIMLISLLALQRFYNRIVIPLSALSNATLQAQNGSLDVRVTELYDDELGRFGRAFNHMAESLEKSHSELAQREKEKSFKLDERTSTLELLYQASQLMSLGSITEGSLNTILDKLASMINRGRFALSLSSFSSSQLIVQINPDRLCNEDDEHQAREIFAIFDEQHHFGNLLWFSEGKHNALTADQRQLIATICDQIAAGLGQIWQNEQTWRLLLVEERATIARELHDSLAQALSYMKMQVSRWQKLSRQGASPERLEQHTLEIRQTLNSAYAQLRELLTTFRLKVDEPGLKSALKATVAEYRQRGEIEIVLDFSEDISCRPGAEIHIIQIVREALSNVVRHAKASKAKVCLEVNPNADESKDGEPYLHISIMDDGVGIPEGDIGPNHHGLMIMRERAKNLDAALSIVNQKDRSEQYSGACVIATCPLSSVVGRDALMHEAPAMSDPYENEFNLEQGIEDERNRG